MHDFELIQPAVRQNAPGKRVASMQRTVALTILIATVSSAKAQETIRFSCNGNECEKHMTVPSGGTAVLAPAIALLNADCTTDEPIINTTVSPKLGRVSPQIYARTLPAVEPSGAKIPENCVGRSVKGLRLIYKANQGAAGSDEIVLKIVAKTTGATFIGHYYVTIR